MAVDLTGGIDPAAEYLSAQRPEDPEMRDSVSFWVFGQGGNVGLPRIGIEAVSANWDTHGLQANIAFPDGRVFRLRMDGAAEPVLGPEGLPTVLGAGPLRFRCVQPFRTWTMTFAGPMVQTSSQDLMEGRRDGPPVEVSFEVEATMAVPPWAQGTLLAEAGSKLEASVEGDLMGGARYEQLFRAAGSVQVGEETHSLAGTGLRIRRRGIRRLTEFWGHCWQSALFPGGRAFGYIAYPPRPDGRPTFNEGYVFAGNGDLVPARVIEAPWLTRLQALGEDVALVLETDRGNVRIEGETIVSTFDIHHDDETLAIQALKEEMPDFPALQQGGVRYRWDGEEAVGMMERSNPLSKISRG